MDAGLTPPCSEGFIRPEGCVCTLSAFGDYYLELGHCLLLALADLQTHIWCCLRCN